MFPCFFGGVVLRLFSNYESLIHQAAVSRTFVTSRRLTRCFARHKSWLYCIASQLSGERPRALESRSAISGLTLLAPLRIRCNVEPATPSFAANSRALRLFGFRYTSVINSPGCGGLCIDISDSPRNHALPHGRATAPSSATILQRNVPMLLRRIGVALILQQSKGADEFGSGLGGFDHFVDEASFGGDVGIGEFVFQFSHLRAPSGGFV